MSLTRLLANICLLLMLPVTTTLAADTGRPDKVSFYFAAHEDDWQLFMNPSAFEDVINGAAKTVFVHLTAGDAGLGIGWRRPQASVLSGARKRRGDRHPLHGGRRRRSRPASRCRTCHSTAIRSTASAIATP